MLGNDIHIDVKVLQKKTNNPLSQNAQSHSADPNQTLAHKSQTYIYLSLCFGLST